MEKQQETVRVAINTCDYKDTTFENTFCKTMAHIIAIALAMFIIWHAVPGSSKIHQLC